MSSLFWIVMQLMLVDDVVIAVRLVPPPGWYVFRGGLSSDLLNHVLKGLTHRRGHQDKTEREIPVPPQGTSQISPPSQTPQLPHRSLLSKSKNSHDAV
jgi:hypothetical protein